MGCLQCNIDCLVCNQCLAPDIHFSGVVTSPLPGVGRGGKADSYFIAEKTDSERIDLPRVAPLAHGRAGSGSRFEGLWSPWVPEKPADWLSFLPGKPPWTHPSCSLTHLCSHFSSVTCCCVTSGSGLTSLFLGLPPGLCWKSESSASMRGFQAELLPWVPLDLVS